MKFSFAVLGDIHYLERKYHKEALNGNKGLDEKQDVERYLWMSENVFIPMMEEIKKYNPDFICQTGDITQGGCEDPLDNIPEMNDALEILTSLGKPVLFAKGNHDNSISYKKVILPYLSGVLKQYLTENYYTFQHNDSCFLFVDDSNFSVGSEQYNWMKEELENNKDKNNIFLFAHSPLFPVARLFFTDRGFVEAILPLLSKNPIKGYFCGHTHNQCLTDHILGDNRIFHAKSSIIGYPWDGLPLDKVRHLTAGDYVYHWGCLEDTCPSWLYVEVDGSEGKLSWQVFPSRKLGALKWFESGRLEVRHDIDMNAFLSINRGELEHIKSASLHMAMYGSRNMNKSLWLNGSKIGYLPQGGAFAPRKTLKIPDNQLSLIKWENIVEIDNPDKELFLIGGIYIEVTLGSGRKSITHVAPNFYTTSHQWDKWNIRELKFFEPGNKIGPVKLNF